MRLKQKKQHPKAKKKTQKQKIKVRQISEKPSWRFDVVIEDNSGRTQHSVSMGKDFYESLKTEVEPWKIIHKSFEFLLKNEPKESILAEFDITIISHYFPDFEEKLLNKLGEKID